MDRAETQSLSPAGFAAHTAFLAPGADSLAVEWYDAGRLPQHLARRWDELSTLATEPNPFAERWFVEPGLAHLAGNEEVRIVAVGDDSGLSGIVPLLHAHSYGRLKVRHVGNWQHCNAFLGTPLIRRGHEQIFWQALLAELDRSDWGVGFLHLTGLVEGGPAHVGLELAARALDRECATVLREERPRLETNLNAEEYLQKNLKSKRRSELRRRRRKLEELGRVETRRLAEGDDIDEWLTAFLALEEAGWKGEAGSALACDPANRNFFRDAVTAAFEAGQLDFLRLDLDGRPVAMMTSLIAPPGAFGFKACFDESFGRFSPGILLQLDNLQIVDRDDIAWQDSCASADHPIASLWSETTTILRLTVPIEGVRNRLVHGAARTLERTSDVVGKLGRAEDRRA